MNDDNNKLIGISGADADTSGQQSSDLPGDDLADTTMQEAENLAGDDFERQAEDERKIEEENIRRALDEAEAKKAIQRANGQIESNPVSVHNDAETTTANAEEISRAARAIYEAANGTPEDDEIRRKIQSKDSEK